MPPLVRLLRVIGGAGLVLILALPAWILVHSADLPNADDADLQETRPEVPAREDAGPLLDRAAAALAPLDDSADWERLAALARDEDWESALADRWLDLGGEALELLHRADAFPSVRIDAEPLDAPETRARTWLRFGQLLALRAAASRHHGEPLRALSEAVKLIRLGRRVEEGSPNLLYAMVSIALRTSGVRQIALTLPAVTIERERARELVRELGAASSQSANWAAVWSGEYRTMVEALEGVHDRAEQECSASEECWGLFPQSYLYQPQRTRAMFAELFRGLRDRAERACSELPPESHSSPSQISLFLRPNPVGRILFEVARPGFTRFHFRRCGFDSLIATAQASVALRAYQRGHGELPATLDAMVPDYLESVPRDAFDGESIRYDARRKLVYSVGSDFRDEGGRPDLSPFDPEDLREPTLVLTF